MWAGVMVCVYVGAVGKRVHTEKLICMETEL